MNIDNLAQDAFMAQALTGYEPTATPPEHRMDAGCAQDENRHPVGEPVMFRIVFSGEVDFTTAVITPIGHFDPGSRLLTLATPDSPASSTSSEETIAVELHWVRRQLTEALRAFQPQLDPDTYAVILRRLGTILDPEEWEPRDPFPDAGSFDQMLCFLARHRDIRAPRIFLSPRRYFVTSWRAARDQLTTLEFNPEGTVRWLVFAPPTSGQGTKQRTAGDETSVTKVLSLIAPHGARLWMKRASE